MVLKQESVLRMAPMEKREVSLDPETVWDISLASSWSRTSLSSVFPIGRPAPLKGEESLGFEHPAPLKGEELLDLLLRPFWLDSDPELPSLRRPALPWWLLREPSLLLLLLLKRDLPPPGDAVREMPGLEPPSLLEPPPGSSKEKSLLPRSCSGSGVLGRPWVASWFSMIWRRRLGLSCLGWK